MGVVVCCVNVVAHWSCASANKTHANISTNFTQNPQNTNLINKIQTKFKKRQQTVYDDLRAFYRRPSKPSGLTIVDSVAVKQPKSSWLEGLSTLLQSSSGLAPQPGLARPSPWSAPRGLYMHGGVGCGKTMLMDVFVRACPPEFQVKRAHFHDFMLDVHSRLRAAAGGGADPLRRVADDIALGAKV